jgi:hypothetical protein
MRGAKGHFIRGPQPEIERWMAKRLKEEEDERVIQEFLAKVRVLLAETYARVDGATRLCEEGGEPTVN